VVEIEVLASLIAFAGLISVWAFAPSKPKAQTAPAAAPKEALA
jgi:hypothetical protein